MCKTYNDVIISRKAIAYIMNKLELELSADKTKIISLWKGKESFDFLGYTNRKTKFKTIKGKEYYSLIQYISNKSKRKIKDTIKTVLARNTLYARLEDKIKELNLKIIGWRNYYKITPYHRLIQIDKYILFRFVIWYNVKRKRRKRQNYIESVKLIRRMGLKYLCY